MDNKLYERINTALSKVNKSNVNSIIYNLNERELTVLRLYIKLNKEDNATVNNIGKVLELSDNEVKETLNSIVRIFDIYFNIKINQNY